MEKGTVVGAEIIKQTLKSSDIFAGLNESDIDRLAQRFQLAEFGDGELLEPEHTAHGDKIFIILSGHLGFTLIVDQEVRLLDQIDAGQLVGEANMIVGHGHETLLQAIETTQLASIDWSDLDELFKHHPETGERFETAMWQQAYRAQFAVHIHSLFGLADPIALKELLAVTKWQQLKHRDVLFREGDPGDAIYVVLTGRLQVTTTAPDNSILVINQIQSGETAGEMAVLSQTPRSATVSASRDTVLAGISKADFNRLIDQYPQAMFQIARMISDRLRHTIAISQDSNSATIFVVVPLHSVVASHEFAAQLGKLMKSFGATICYSAEQVEKHVGKTGLAQISSDKHRGSQLSHWFYEQEISHRYIIYIADPDWSNWTRRVITQADHILLIADADAPAELTAVEKQLTEHQDEITAVKQSLLLIHKKGSRINATAKWLEPRPDVNHYHLRCGNDSDYHRLARILTGNSISLVLGGGGARGYAHIGVIKALEEQGIPIDMIGGTSIGSIIAAAYAMECDAKTIHSACDQHFRKLFDFTFPMLALITGKRIVTKLRNFFGDMQIEDMSLPYFCVSSNLTRAQAVTHRHGDIVAAIRASMSVPGFVPPVTVSGDLLVDGGLLNNLPVDIMRTQCGRGKIIAIDISPKVDLAKNQEMPVYLSGWRMLFTRLNPFSDSYAFNIIAVLMRSMTLGAVNNSMRLQQQAPADLYLLLPMESVSTLDYEDIGLISNLGYESSQAKISDWWEASKQETTDDPA